MRDILIHTFGHPSALIVTDSSLGSGRGSPDLLLKAPVGLNDRTGRPLVAEWAVVEVKDEHDAFANPARRESIFTEKSKYIGLNHRVVYYD